MDEDRNYFARRAQEERDAARKSKHRVARERHNEMAEAYEARERAVAADEARSTFRAVSNG
jgi:hypothetical protein